MARSQNPRLTSSSTRGRVLATNEAREQLFKLVNRLSRLKKASRSLTERAVEIGPRGQAGAVLLPKVDVDAAVARIAELEDEVEDLTLAYFVEQRLRTPVESLLSVEELADSVGRSDVLDR